MCWKHFQVPRCLSTQLKCNHGPSKFHLACCVKTVSLVLVHEYLYFERQMSYVNKCLCAFFFNFTYNIQYIVILRSILWAAGRQSVLTASCWQRTWTPPGMLRSARLSPSSSFSPLLNALSAAQSFLLSSLPFSLSAWALCQFRYWNLSPFLFP